MAPLGFAAFLLFFMMSGKGTKPLEKDKRPPKSTSRDDTLEENK
jgi:hypothetical protein